MVHFKYKLKAELIIKLGIYFHIRMHYFLQHNSI